MRRFPLAFAHVEMVGARRAAPVDLAQRVARLKLAELPERLARPGAPAAVQAVRDRLRDALRVDEDFRQAVGEAVRFAFERQDPGTLGRILADARRSPLLLHRCHEPRDDGAEVLAFGAGGERQRHAVLQDRSASDSTSSTDGARRPSISALARTASISAWLARGPGPQAT